MAAEAADLASKLNLGRFIKKIGDFEVYENGEVFYRAMPDADFKKLLSKQGLQPSIETFTSPTLSYIKNKGYEGIIVKLQLKRGTLDMLKSRALINDETSFIRGIFGNNLPNYPKDVIPEGKSWTRLNYALFKTEGEQVNIGLGRGELFKEFNSRIVGFEEIK